MVQRKTLLFILFIFLIPFLGFGQHKVDSLSGKSFKELRTSYHKYINDSTKALKYATRYLLKAKKLKDSLKIANGYYYLIYFKPEKEWLSYCDSMLVVTKNKKNELFPSLAYYIKGNYYGEKYNYSKSLDNYLLAYRFTKNKTMIHGLKKEIGLLKTRYGDDKEALVLFKEAYQFSLKKKFDKTYRDEYFLTLFALSNSYLRNGFIDSSSYYNKKGFQQFSKKNDSLFSNYFRLEQGLVELKKERFTIAIDSVAKSLLLLKKIKDLPNIAYANYILGKSYFGVGEIEKSVLYFKKVDSVFSIVKDIHPDLRVSYEYLINYYKENKNLHKQLEYVKKLLQVDSTLNANYKTVKKKLFYSYDTPKLLKSKNILISKLENNIKWSNKALFLLAFILIVFVFTTVHQFKKRKTYKKNFRLLMEDSNFNGKKIVKKVVKKDLHISPDIIKDITTKLAIFEKEKRFLKQKIKITDLANKFNTNGKYLSVIINQYKNKNFSNYLNDLRIGYIIEELKTNAVYKKYTIKAISIEAGFSNAESFAKAFYSKTQMHPSFFINQLKKQKLL